MNILSSRNPSFFMIRRIAFSLFLFSIVIGGIGLILWVFLRTYFWYTSDVTVLTDGDIVSGEIRISAQIVHADIPLFW